MFRKLTDKMIYNLFKRRPSTHPVLTPVDIEIMLSDVYDINYTPATVRVILKEVVFSPLNPTGFLHVAQSKGRDTLYYLKGETMKKRRFVIGWE